ncbi:MAG: hypothetical protein ACJ780_23120 [Solirubrobacteraceae bacterium]
MSIVATAALVKMIYSSAIAGISVAVVFSIAVFGVVRSNDMRRTNRHGASARYATLGAAALITSIAIAIAGVILVVHKS